MVPENVDHASSNHSQAERGKWLAAFPCRIRKAGQPETFQVRLEAPYLPIRKCLSPPVALAGRLFSVFLFAQCPCLINPPGGDKGEGDGLICFPVSERRAYQFRRWTNRAESDWDGDYYSRRRSLDLSDVLTRIRMLLTHKGFSHPLLLFHTTSVRVCFLWLDICTHSGVLGTRAYTPRKE